ncbi:MAG: phosphatase PAP2 family protein [Zoogloeaceae bacterium]|nr:phosphatase PAP2 family protein [Rhodocyclaceae bacterium]MCP5236933.1 phosphatase PAP2 family protein [Zoogloeaceae bacterium]
MRRDRNRRQRLVTRPDPVGAICLLAAPALLAAGGLWLCPGGACRLPAVDASLLTAAHAIRSPVVDAVAAWATWLGSLFVLGPLAMLTAVRLWLGNQVRNALALVLSLGGATALGQLAKLALARPRPALFATVGELPNSWSYPSGHGIQAAATVVTLAMLLPDRQRRAGLVVAVALATLVGATRVYLQVHFPTDVLFGLVAGGLWATGVWRLAQASDRPPGCRG